MGAQVGDVDAGVEGGLEEGRARLGFHAKSVNGEFDHGSHAPED